MLRRLTRLSAVVLGTSLACRINRERLAYAMDRDDEKAAAVDANGNPINLILEPERIAEVREIQEQFEVERQASEADQPASDNEQPQLARAEDSGRASCAIDESI